MRYYRFLAIPFVMIFILAGCMANGTQQVSTQLPGSSTSMPTDIVATQQSSSNCPASSAASGLGISVDSVKTLVQTNAEFILADGTVGNQAASIVTLASFPGFSAQFIGDPCNLSEIKFTSPGADQGNTLSQGAGLINSITGGVIPAAVQIPFMIWFAQIAVNILPVGVPYQTTQGNMQFTVQRIQNDLVLDIVPAK